MLLLVIVYLANKFLSLSLSLYGRAYATGLRLIVSLLFVVCNVMYCGYTARPIAKVTINSIYMKSYMRNRLFPKWMTLTSV